MQRDHCGQGMKLYEVYQQKSLDLVVADGEKRIAVALATRDEWRAVARSAEEAKTEHDRARGAYIEHMVGCKVCAWDQLAHTYLEAMEHAGLAIRPEAAEVAHTDSSRSGPSRAF